MLGQIAMNTDSSMKGRVPTVSVIILNFNGLHDTQVCLRSLVSDGYPNKQIIVWDNGSLPMEAETIRKEFPHVLVIHSQENQLYAGGNNKAAEHATGEILIFLNNDTEVTPGWIVPLLDAFATVPSLGACQPKILSWYDRTRFDYAGGCGGFVDCLGFPFMRGRMLTTLEKDIGQYDGNTTDLDWVSGACFAVRRKVFFDYGMFDTDFHMYSEEFDLSWRLKNEGWKLGCTSASVIYHKGGRSWIGRSDGPCFYRHRNTLLTLVKHLPPTQLFLILLLRLPLEIFAPIYYVCTGNVASALAPVRALASFLWLSKKFAAKRYTSLNCLVLSGKPFLLWEYYIRRHRTFSSLTRK